MQSLSPIRQTVVCTVYVILICGALLGCESAQQSHKASVVPSASPTWRFSSIPLTATLVPTPGADSQKGVLAGGVGISGSHAETSGQFRPTPDPEEARRGQRLFYEVGCFHCHGVTAEGLVGPRIARTDISLDGVINQVYQPVGDMPAFSEEGVSKSDVAAIYAYLQSLEPTGPRPEITADRSDSSKGEVLYRYFGCFGCHGYQAEGGFGPPLAGTELGLQELRTQVRKPRERMPACAPERISDEELARIDAFLQSVAPDKK